MREFNKVKKLQPVLMQRYESVIEDTPGAVREIAEFLGMHIDTETAMKVAEDNSIANVKAAGKALSHGLSWWLKTLLTRCVLRPISKHFRICKMMRKVGFSDASINRIRSSLLYKGFFRLAISMYPQDPASLIHSDHISRHAGAAGAWREDLSNNEIIEITRRYEGWLIDLGYALE